MPTKAELMDSIRRDVVDLLYAPRDPRPEPTHGKMCSVCGKIWVIRPGEPEQSACICPPEYISITVHVGGGNDANKI